MTLNDIYYTAEGLAYQKGCNYFEVFMPKERVVKLMNAILETKGFKYLETNFINWIINIALKEELKNNAYKIPTCKKDCHYRQKYADYDLQINALRIEILPFNDRCSWNLKPGRIGGRPDDYYICEFN